MKKIIPILFILIIPLWAGFYILADQPVEQDEAFEQVILDALQIEKLTPQIIESTTELNLSNRYLLSIEGLERFTNLEKLDVSNNLLTNINEISKLPNLIELDISFNQLENINLQNPLLQKVQAESNLLTSVEFIEQIETLTYLDIRDNRVTDLAPLEKLINLSHLNIRDNQVSTLETLETLTQLRNLNIRNNKIHSIAPIANLPLYERLSVAGNEITDLDLLENKIIKIHDYDFEVDLPQPTLSKPSGVYAQNITLEIDASEGTPIHYTLDGSTPTLKSPTYTGPINISNQLIADLPIIANNKTSYLHDGYNFTANDVKQAVTITAIATRKLGMDRVYSDPVQATYILDENVFASELPVISIVVDPKDLYNQQNGIFTLGEHYEGNNSWTGNFFQKGKEFEKAASMSFFNPDGTVDFEQNIGLRIHGRASRRFPQKSLRIYARDKYGQGNMYTDIFKNLPYNSYENLMLRTSGQDNNKTMLRDGLMQELVKDLNVDVQAYEPTIVMINGEYWGIHNMRERLDAKYINNKYNVQQADVVLLDAYLEDATLQFEVKAGNKKSKRHFEEVIEFTVLNDMTHDDNVKFIETQIDLDSYLHYVAYQVYYANTDSFSNNHMLWRKNVDYMPDAPTGHDGRWKWILYDVDYGMGNYIHSNQNYTGDPVDFNMFDFILADEERMDFFRNLIENEAVKTQFIETMLNLLETNFEPATVQLKINELAKTIRPEVEKSITRWENIPTVAKWEENIKVLHDFADKRPAIVREQMRKKFELTEAELAEIEGE